MSLSPGHGNPPAFIESSGRPAYLAPTMFRFVSSLLIAIALLFSPLAMASGEAMAAPHSSTTAIGMDGHCAETGAPSDHDQSDAMADCAVACATFLAVEPAISDNGPHLKTEALSATYETLIGIRPEGETPPPRITPEI